MFEVVKDPEGKGKERRPRKITEANVANEIPLKWTGKLMKKAEIFNRFVFASKIQITHVNGLTYDFLFTMATMPADADSLMLVGARARRIEPLILRRGGTAYRRTAGARMQAMDHVAYQMVRPEWVIEISCLDLISETTRGATIDRMVLNWDADASEWRPARRLPLVSVVSPVFQRIREDKTVNPQDVRVAQLTELVEISLADQSVDDLAMPKSEVLKRVVMTKTLKGAVMVRKLLMCKTHKENETEAYPAYVIHLTDFSPNRKSLLDREVRVSESREQIDALRFRLWTVCLDRGQAGKCAVRLWSSLALPGFLVLALASLTARAEVTETTFVLVEPGPPQEAPGRVCAGHEAQRVGPHDPVPAGW